MYDNVGARTKGRTANVEGNDGIVPYMDRPRGAVAPRATGSAPRFPSREDIPFDAETVVVPGDDDAFTGEVATESTTVRVLLPNSAVPQGEDVAIVA